MCRPASPSQEHDSCVTMESIVKKILNVLPWGAVRIVARFYWKKKLIEASRSSAPHQAGMKLLMAKFLFGFLSSWMVASARDVFMQTRQKGMGEERMTKEWQIKAATSKQAQLVLWQCSAGVII